MTLRLRKAKDNRPGPPEWSDEDYDVTWTGQAVGRIYRRSGAADEAQSWFWSILIAAAPGITTNGLAETLDEAKAELAKNWRMGLASMPDDQAPV